MLTQTKVWVNTSAMRCGQTLERNPPVAIGAIGGSGSRLLARIVQEAGVFMGGNLNASHDNLEFTRRFKRPEILTATDAEFETRALEFAHLMRHGMTNAGASCWGWKEPNTHIVIERLLRCFPTLRYVHLLRSGLDMAFSDNRNQVRLWGPILLNRRLEDPPGPADALEYFCTVHRRLAALAASPEGQGRMLFVHFEELCQSPEREIARLLEFLNFHPPAGGEMEKLKAEVSPPPTIGRWRKHGLQAFRQEDLAYLEEYLPETLAGFHKNPA